MKTNFFVDYQGQHVDTKVVELRVKEVWKNDGKLVKDIKTLDIYYKPEEKKVYYVVNQEHKYSFDV